MARAPYVLQRAALLVAAAAVAGCTEQMPLTSPVKPDVPAERPANVLANLTCVASRIDRSVSCQPAGFQFGGSGLKPDLIFGNQNIYVKVTSTFLGYNSGTQAFTFNVDVRNLIPQPLGTTDGTTQDPNGVRVFFHSGPTPTSGSGTITVVGDGTATFTAPNQPYYQYTTVLDQFEVTAPKLWTLSMPSTVTTFTFGLLISAAVPRPAGWIDVIGSPSAVYPGTTKQLAPFVRNAFGFIDGSAGPVGWNSGTPGMAIIDGTGLVTAISAGDVTMTGMESVSPFRTGTFLVTVTGATRTWTGTTSPDWSVVTNWSATPSAAVPVSVDSAVIPTGVPNFPALVAGTTIARITVADGATVSLGAFNLTSSTGAETGYTAGSGILSTTGRLILSGTGTSHGRFPSTLVTGVATTSNDVFIVAPLDIDAGTLQIEAHLVTIDAQ